MLLAGHVGGVCEGETVALVLLDDKLLRLDDPMLEGDAVETLELDAARIEEGEVEVASPGFWLIELVDTLDDDAAVVLEAMGTNSRAPRMPDCPCAAPRVPFM